MRMIWQDIVFAFKCHHAWYTKQLVTSQHQLTTLHICKRTKWHFGPHRDRLGLEKAKSKVVQSACHA